MTFAPESLAPPTGLRAALARLPLLVLALATVACVLQVLAHVAQSDDFVLKHLVLDDAIYYCKPARNFVDGRGYSFDGVHRTNGVQPLWAMVTTALAFVVRDDLWLLRATAALSGLLWMASGVLLYVFLRPWGGWAACIPAVGWMLAGIEFRLGLSGMENGLQGFLILGSLLLGARLASTPPAAPEWRRRALHLGFCAAAVCLNRVEFGVLAIAWGAWLLVLQWRAQPPRRALAAVACYALPVLALGAAWGLTSKLYFGDFRPISGDVKAWMTSVLPNPHGGLASTFVHHLLEAIRLAVWPLVIATGDLAYRLFGLALGAADFAWIFAAAFGLLLVPALTPRALRARRDGATWPVLWLLAFCLVHLVLVSIYLAVFTDYCSWYFTPEILSVWLVAGLLLASADRGWRRLFALPLAVLVFAGAVHRGAAHLPQPPRHSFSSTGDFVELARWLERWLPQGSVVGIFNAGFVGLLAKSHTVVNLDGLMNDGRYLREYLSKNRTDVYMREEGIAYLADRWPVSMWRDTFHGIGHRLPENMRPLYCQRAHADSLTCVFALPQADGSAAVPAHPLAALLWRTLTAAPPPVVSDAGLASVPASHQVAATYLEPPAMIPMHVVVPRAEARSAVDAAGLDRLTAVGAAFGERVQLLAVELPPGRVDPGATVAITTYWRPLPGLAQGGDLRLCLRLGAAGAPAVERCDAPAHGTLPLQQWPQEQILAHTFCVAVPADREGLCDVWVAVQPGDGPGVRVGALRLERY